NLNSERHLNQLGDKAKEGIELIERQLDKLSKIVNRASQEGKYDSAYGRLGRWKERTAKLLSECVSQEEADKFLEVDMTWATGNWLSNLAEESEMYQGHLVPLMEELQAHPEDILVLRKDTDTENNGMERKIPLESRTVFIVHGHDEANTLRLEKLLGDHWNLEPIVLRDRPGKGRTLIEKFEQEAKQSAYAFVLFTPDDLIDVPQSGESYTQARPNVIFELGWFYGRLSRERVCILFKKGTKIPSDLGGINRIEYSESIEEKILDIEKELKAAGLL
ncbi:MAG: nucleotide-binding protein, partial [Candidatus Marinimicrobia bacterium]|nr:nucleotide-binding protein [Candidatus Neomarinimicrobiota bacterium]